MVANERRDSTLSVVYFNPFNLSLADAIQVTLGARMLNSFDISQFELAQEDYLESPTFQVGDRSVPVCITN